MDALRNGCTNLLFGQSQFVFSILERDASSTNYMKSLEDPDVSTYNFIHLMLNKEGKNIHWKEESILSKHWKKPGGPYAEK